MDHKSGFVTRENETVLRGVGKREIRDRAVRSTDLREPRFASGSVPCAVDRMEDLACAARPAGLAKIAHEPSAAASDTSSCGIGDGRVFGCGLGGPGEKPEKVRCRESPCQDPGDQYSMISRM